MTKWVMCVIDCSGGRTPLGTQGGGWDEKPKLVCYRTKRAAEAAVDELVRDCQRAAQWGEMHNPTPREDYEAIKLSPHLFGEWLHAQNFRPGVIMNMEDDTVFKQECKPRPRRIRQGLVSNTQQLLQLLRRGLSQLKHPRVRSARIVAGTFPLGNVDIPDAKLVVEMQGGVVFVIKQHEVATYAKTENDE